MPIPADPPRVIVVGSHGPGLFVHVKRIPAAGETVPGWNLEAPVDGAKGSNQAVAAARWGARASLVSCVGLDELGETSLRWLADAGVDLTHVRRSPTAATLGGFVILDEHGTPAIISLPGAGAEMTPDEVTDAVTCLLPAEVLVTQFELPVEIALHAARLGREHGLLTLINPSPAPPGGVARLDAADVLVPNEFEALTLLGLEPQTHLEAGELAERVWRHTGAGSVMLTVGERGVAYAGPEGCWQVSPPVVQAVDTTGAGDAFCGALAAALGRGEPRQSAAQQACRAAAYSVTRPGTIPAFPTPAQVAAFFADGPAAG
jgi:ribokinase